MRSVVLVAGAAVLAAAGVILSLALGLSLAWDEVPPPPDPGTSSVPSAAFAALVIHSSGGLEGPPLVAGTIEGRQA